MSPLEVPLWDAIDAIREHDRRYRREAYLFVVAALGATVQNLPPKRREHPVRRHLSGAELVHGLLALARREFGPLAPTVFREWGLYRSEDVGTIVFQLVRGGQLSARPEDSIEDFRGGPDLLRALETEHAPRPPDGGTHRSGPRSSGLPGPGGLHS